MNTLSQIYTSYNTLSQSHLEGLPSYVMTTSRLPTSVSTKLDQIHRTYFWHQSPDKKSISMISWDRICQPKSMGGLGLRKTPAVNTAFLAKLGWKIISDHSNLWVQSIHAKYLKTSSFFECSPQPKDSLIWKKILQIRPLLLKGIRWKVGSGTSILFWLDNWCAPTNLLTLLNIDPPDAINLELTVDFFITTAHQWDTTKLQQFLPQPGVHKIVGIPLPSTPTPDEPCWGFSPYGNFTVKSATWLAHNNILSNTKWEFSWIWKLDIAPKLKIFLWQVLHNGLPTRVNLSFRNIDVPTICPFCNSHLETQDHLFLSCPKVLFLWSSQHVQLWLKFTYSQTNIQDLFRFLRTSVIRSTPKIVTFLWSIWKLRNAMIFNTVPFSLNLVFTKAIKIYDEWNHRTFLDSLDTFPSSNTRLSGPSLPKPKYIRWEKPPTGTIKLNFDGSFNNNVATAGVILRNHLGDHLDNRTYNIGQSSPLLQKL